MKLKSKFGLAILASIVWGIFTMYFGIPWIADIAIVFSLSFAWFSVIGIALIPGLAMAFINASLIMDKRKDYNGLKEHPPVSILIAAKNEEENIKYTLESILRQQYDGDIQVIILNDGSTDTTIMQVGSMIDNQKWINKTKPHLYNKNVNVKLYNYNQSVGKANRLNDGLSFAKHDFIITLDADSVLHTPKAVYNLMAHIINRGEDCAAVAGTILVDNGYKSLMTRIQQWDYIFGIASVKRIQSMYKGTLVAQGAFSVYKKSVLKELGGWPDKIGEDIVLTWGIHSLGYKVGYEANAIAFTNVPETYKHFFRQRKRWARGLIEAFKSYPKNLFAFKMHTPFVWYNFVFPYIDFTFLFIFVPGVIAALFFEWYLMASIMTLYLLPIGLISNFIMYRIQKKSMKNNLLEMHQKNKSGFFIYLLFYQLIMTPATLSGYVSELLKRKRIW